MGRAEPLYWAASEVEAGMNLRANARKAAEILPHALIARRLVVLSKVHILLIREADDSFMIVMEHKEDDSSLPHAVLAHHGLQVEGFSAALWAVDREDTETPAGEVLLAVLATVLAKVSAEGEVEEATGTPEKTLT